MKEMRNNEKILQNVVNYHILSPYLRGIIEGFRLDGYFDVNYLFLVLSFPRGPRMLCLFPAVHRLQIYILSIFKRIFQL
jgi:hypothetical protein